MALAKMRTAQQLYDEIHRDDPDSSISLWYIRSLIKQGKIPVVKAGCKYLINYDKFMDYLNSEPIEEDVIPFSCGTIRRVME